MKKMMAMLIVGLLAATAWSGETLEVRGALTNTLMVIPTNLWHRYTTTIMSTGSWWGCISAADLNEIRLAEGGRMSSPVETLTVVTNVTTASNESGCSICSGNPPGVTPAVFHLGGLTGCQPYKPATEKTETTTVVEVKTLRFTWDGTEYMLKSQRILSTKVRRWVRKDNWVEE